MQYVVVLMHQHVDRSEGRERVRHLKTGQIECRSRKEAERVERLFDNGAVENMFAVVCVRVMLSDQRMVPVPVDTIAEWAHEMNYDSERETVKPIKAC